MPTQCVTPIVGSLPLCFKPLISIQESREQHASCLPDGALCPPLSIEHLHLKTQQPHRSPSTAPSEPGGGPCWSSSSRGGSPRRLRKHRNQLVYPSHTHTPPIQPLGWATSGPRQTHANRRDETPLTPVNRAHTPPTHLFCVVCHLMYTLTECFVHSDT